MQRPSHPRDKWRDVVFGGVTLLVILADQFSKWWIRGHLSPNSVLFDAGLFQIARVHNTGAAFGLFRGHIMVLTIISFVGMVLILLFVFFLRRRWSFLDSRRLRVAIGLVMGGTIGNLIDRFFLHQVTDFIDFKVWPAFNVADSAICIGVGLYILSALWTHTHPLKEPAPTPPDSGATGAA